MKRIAILATLVAVAACNKSDRANTTDTSMAGGSVAPASADSTGSMSSGSSTGMSSGSSTSGSNMSSGASTSGGTGTGSSATGSSNMSGNSSTSGGSRMGDSGSSQMKGAVPNQSQSGVTDSSGKSTLGPNVTKTSPTSKAPVTAKGDTLKKKPSTNP